MSAPTDMHLARNRRSAYIHREGCLRLRPDHVHWDWADKNPDVDWKSEAPWLKACSICNPPNPASFRTEAEKFREAWAALDDLRKARVMLKAKWEQRPIMGIWEDWPSLFDPEREQDEGEIRACEELIAQRPDLFRSKAVA